VKGKHGKANEPTALTVAKVPLARPRSVEELVRTVSEAIVHARRKVAISVNSNMTWLYWGIGRHIVEFERGGKRAVYGQELLKVIARKLESRFGRGFSWRNLYSMCKFYEGFPDPNILQTVSAKLPWSSLCRILSVRESGAREFYLQLALKEVWSYRLLKRHVQSGLYHRTSSLARRKMLAKDSIPAVLEPEEVIRDPYVFEFLGFQDQSYSENDLETALVSRLQSFLTELGKGFCFEARQRRIDLSGKDYYVDLVFYHRFLKSSILVDLKVGEFAHSYAGQMNYYLNWWKQNEMAPGDQPPIGIILCATKDDAHVEFTLGGIANRIFVSRYQTSLPTQTELQDLLMKTQDKWESEHKKLPSAEIERINEGSR